MASITGAAAKRAVVALMAVLIGACAAPVPTTSPTTVPTYSASASPSPSPLPTPSPTSEPVLRVGGMARVISTVTGSSGTEMPGADTPRINEREVVYVADGPRLQAGNNQWLLATDTDRGVRGWFAEQTATGKLTLSPFNPDCPDPNLTLTLDDLRPLGRLGAMSCFGSLDITLRGHIDCYLGTEDGGLGGAPFTFDGTHCYMNGYYPILGKPMTRALSASSDAYPLAGTYLVRGHFDDPGSTNCGFYRFATSVLEYQGDPNPVMACRTQFVATSVTKLEE